MNKEKYMKMRQKAISKLTNAQLIDSECCMVEDTKVLIQEKAKLLEQLVEEYEYLSVPVELLLTSGFWREIKAESNTRIRQLKIQ